MRRVSIETPQATAVGEAFNRAVSENSDTASEIGTAFDKAVDALWSAERAATAVILKQGGAWSEIIDLLMTSTGHVRSAREIILLSLPEGDQKNELWSSTLAVGNQLEDVYYQAILLACEQKP